MNRIIERWFAELTIKWLRRCTHHSVTELETSIAYWVSSWNDNPRPFVWHRTADEGATWAAELSQVRTWGVEGASSLGRHTAVFLGELAAMSVATPSVARTTSKPSGSRHRPEGVRCGRTPGLCDAWRVRVLRVDDEERLVRSLRRGLQREGFAVDAAHNGEQGLWMAQENDYDAIVLDIMLPGLNGYQVCAALREADVWTPILMLTAKEGEHDHAEALDTGAADFLMKPFSYVVLVAHLRALIRRTRRTRPVVLTAGDIRLDPASHRCWRGDVEVELTPRQFALLEYLMTRVGEVISKTAILEHVWDDAYDSDPNLVEVYVGYLRKKLDIPFGRTSIQTVRLVGYRLDPDGG